MLQWSSGTGCTTNPPPTTVLGVTGVAQACRHVCVCVWTHVPTVISSHACVFPQITCNPSQHSALFLQFYSTLLSTGKSHNSHIPSVIVTMNMALSHTVVTTAGLQIHFYSNPMHCCTFNNFYFIYIHACIESTVRTRFDIRVYSMSF